MTIYERVRETAKEQGMSLKKLESKAKLGDGAIYKWKTYTPRYSNIQKVADVLGVSVNYLLDNTLKKDMKPEIRRISNDINELDEEDIEHISAMVAAFLKNKK